MTTLGDYSFFWRDRYNAASSSPACYVTSKRPPKSQRSSIRDSPFEALNRPLLDENKRREPFRAHVARGKLDRTFLTRLTDW